jgi:hypothetical protein
MPVITSMSAMAAVTDGAVIVVESAWGTPPVRDGDVAAAAAAADLEEDEDVTPAAPEPDEPPTWS